MDAVSGNLFARSGPIVFVMLNPSTADAGADDPTLRRCLGFAHSLDVGGGDMRTPERGAVLSTDGRYRLMLWRMYGALRVVNLYAYRTPYPDAMFAVSREVDIIGPGNDAAILGACAGDEQEPGLRHRAAMIIASWGADKRCAGRALEVRSLLASNGFELRALGISDGGAPRHPLHLPRNRVPVSWP